MWFIHSKKAPRKTRAGKPLRVGLWCDYDNGVTILPDEGIGVFVYNLATGLLGLDEPVEVVLLVKDGDQERVHQILGGWREGLEIAPPPPRKLPWPARLGECLRAWVRRSDGVRARLAGLAGRCGSWRQAAVARARPMLKTLAQKGRRGSPAALLGLALDLPALFLLAWGVDSLARCAVTALHILAFPAKVCDKVVRWLSTRGRFARPEERRPTSLEAAAAANCDVWMLPQVLFPHPITFPSVVMIHDFVSSHFVEAFNRWYPGYHDHAARLMPVRAAEATICACMSAYIRDTDLLGVLQLPPAKVRMVRSASPADLPDLTEPAEALKPAWLKRPYLYWPTAFRPYKNHRGLIEALRLLRDRYGENQFDVVFTGGTAGDMPTELQELVKESGLVGRVHVLGRVDRKTLAALFQCAYATIVPTFYEQGSFQIYEALWRGCPVASSNIPQLLEQCAAMGDAMLYFDPHDADAIARTILHIRDHRQAIIERQRSAGRVLWRRTWKDVAREWLPIFKEAAEIHRLPGYWQQRRLVHCWPQAPIAVPAPSALPEVFLFLSLNYSGGVWEATKDLLRALVEINQQRRELTLTVGLHDEQEDTAAVEALRPGLGIERFQLEHLTRAEAVRLLGEEPAYLARYPEETFLFLAGSTASALRADAWFALADRFWSPLLPARPYGVFVYDMIQRHAPEVFDQDFFYWVQHGITPTVKGANVVLTTSRATQADVLAEYGLDTSRVRLIPWACEPHRRFAGISARHMELAREPFILQVANGNPHKGAAVLLRAHARLRERLGGGAPLLVLAGLRTDLFAPSYRGTFDHPMFQQVRRLVAELKLEEGRDVAFLGFVADEQLRDLYERAGVVVNAAKYDNGSFCLIEGRYFGRPTISSRYPAAEALVERFGLPTHFFPVEDDVALAQVLEVALRERPVTGVALERVRRRLADPEFSHRRYAEQVYELLVELARQGRRERGASPVAAPRQGYRAAA